MEAKPKYKTKGKARALPWLLFQGYCTIDSQGKPVTDEQVEEAFERRHGYPPKTIKRNGGAVLAGPVILIGGN